ncbi:3184_t:CDS:2 [Acaulospora morrowiae]|uniref:3184_t:CDS:1 n=1 Tax=Acaulospora morrowiae TaxID=94023 RepID=A0A9N9C9N8_9GLOM|nr:3184_t:CDS:2 [Acaulospora morrowiae]
MGEEQWAILFDHIRAEDYKRNLQTLNEYNLFLEELPSLIRIGSQNGLLQCSRCQRISQSSQEYDDLRCHETKYFHEIERVTSVANLRDTRVDVEMLEKLFILVGTDFELFHESIAKFFEHYEIYLCQRCDKLSNKPEHSGHPYLTSFNHLLFPTHKNPLIHKNSLLITNLAQLKGIEFDLLEFFDVLKDCVDSMRPAMISGKWNVGNQEISPGRRNFYNGNFGTSEWEQYIKIDEFHRSNESLEIYTQFLRNLPQRLHDLSLFKCLNCNVIFLNAKKLLIGPCNQTNLWIDKRNYLPIMPHIPKKIDMMDVFMNSKVSLNCLGDTFAERYNVFLNGVLGFSYFVKHCEIFVCIRCGSFSALVQGGSLCRKPYHDHVFRRIFDVYQFYDELINLFDFHYVIKSALDIAYPDKPIYRKANGVK